MLFILGLYQKQLAATKQTLLSFQEKVTWSFCVLEYAGLLLSQFFSRQGQRSRQKRQDSRLLSYLDFYRWINKHYVQLFLKHLSNP